MTNTTPAWKAYLEAIEMVVAAAGKAYKENTDSAWKAHEEAFALALEAYRGATGKEVTP